MYERMKVDVGRHETLCFELATKFDQQYEVIWNLTNSMDSLKNYALLNDLHLEAYLPFQMAGLAFEVGKGLIQPNKKERFKKHTLNVFKTLEKNCLNVCDPSCEESRFRKMQYKIPSQLKQLEQKKDWEMILTDITLENIHLYNMPEDNRVVTTTD